MRKQGRLTGSKHLPFEGSYHAGEFAGAEVWRINKTTTITG
jgi:hypothetical protein